MKIDREQTKKNKLEWEQKKKTKEVVDLVHNGTISKNDAKEELYLSEIHSVLCVLI